MLKSDIRLAAPVLDEFGSSGDHFWFLRAVVLERRAAVAARPDESWSIDQICQFDASRRQLHSDCGVGASAPTPDTFLKSFHIITTIGASET